MTPAADEWPDTPVAEPVAERPELAAPHVAKPKSSGAAKPAAAKTAAPKPKAAPKPAKKPTAATKAAPARKTPRKKAVEL
jgi:hypothetical protein